MNRKRRAVRLDQEFVSQDQANGPSFDHTIRKRYEETPASGERVCAAPPDIYKFRLHDPLPNSLSARLPEPFNSPQE